MIGVYLCKSSDEYHINTEEQAKAFIEEAKSSSEFQLKKYLCEYKEIKSKGEVIDTYYKVTLVKEFNDIKEPMYNINIEYNIDNNDFQIK